MCATAKRSTVGLNGDTRRKILSSMKRLLLYKNEVQDISEMNDLVTKLQKEKEELKKQMKVLEEKCENLLHEILQEKENIQKISHLEDKVCGLESMNTELLAYISGLEQKDICHNCDSTFCNKGQAYHKVSYSQKQRKLKQIKSNAEKALWFLESFGIKIDKLLLTDTASNENINLKFNESVGKAAYKSLTAEEQDKIKQVVYIMDSFCVSDAAYHELSMIDSDGLPRSYLIKQCRMDLNSIHSVSRTPGSWPGAQLSFKVELHNHLSKLVRAFTD
jgi:uncharacterized coiled-coil protein SlyX